MNTQFVIRLLGIGAAVPTYLAPLGGAPMGGEFDHAAKFADVASAQAALDICSAHNVIGAIPCLRGKIDACGIQPARWDVDFWMKAQGPWSHGEKHAAAFVACAWNPGYAKSKKWRFDLIDALGTWDNKNRQAFLAWAARPIYP